VADTRGGKSHVPIRRAGGKAVISRLAEGAIDGATLRASTSVWLPTSAGPGSDGKTYVPDTTFHFYWSSGPTGNGFYCAGQFL